MLALSLLYALAFGAETTMYQIHGRLIEHIQGLQDDMALVQPTQTMAQQVVQRLSVDSLHDPAMAQLLKKYGVKVVYKETPTSLPVEVPDQNAGKPPAPAPGTIPGWPHP